MGLKPTIRSYQSWQTDGGEDFLQGKTSDGSIKFWIDAGGVFNPTTGNVNLLNSENIYVDANNALSTGADGSVTNPFPTIMDAVSKVAAIGQSVDGSSGLVTTPYTIYVAAGAYPETIDLSNPALRYLTFVGYGALVGSTNLLVNPPVVQAINNDNLTDVNFIGFTFYSGTGSTHSFNFSSTTNGTSFGNGANGYGITFTDCVFRSGSGDFYVNNCGNVTWNRCYISFVVNITNCILADVIGSSFNQGSQLNLMTTGGASPSGFSLTQGQSQNSAVSATVSTDAGSAFVAIMGSRIRSAVIVNGIFTNRSSSISGAITVNSGGTYKEDTGGGHSGALTVNSGGTYTQTGTYGIGTLILNGSQLSTGTGSPNGAVTSNPGDLYLNQGGGSATTLWVKESGTNTNTGWVGK